MSLNTNLNNNIQSAKGMYQKEEIKSDIKKMGSNIREDAVELTHDIGNYASSKAESTVEQLRAQLKELKSCGKRELSHFEHSVTENPLRSIAIAAGIGAVLSVLFGRR